MNADLYYTVILVVLYMYIYNAYTVDMHSVQCSKFCFIKKWRQAENETCRLFFNVGSSGHFIHVELNGGLEESASLKIFK